jgi:hypothetical protein
MASDDRSIKPPARIPKGALAGLVVVLVVIAAFAGLIAGIAVVSSLLWLVVGAAIVATVVTVYRWRRQQRSGS